jgi:hypothetical protein
MKAWMSAMADSIDIMPPAIGSGVEDTSQPVDELGGGKLGVPPSA